ncbi:MAG TPA: ATP-binding protein [Actinomycetota bacterium]|nr:ATP-binding protein [Actinomycetota bacterium]
MTSAMTLEIPARSVYVGVVRLALGSIARIAEMDDEKVEDLRMAVSEACANAVMVNDAAGNGAPVTVIWREEAGAVIVEVGDRGAGTGPDPESSTGDAERLEMSVALLRSLVDECAFEPRPEGGMITKLTVRK